MGTFSKIDKRIGRIMKELKRVREDNDLMRQLVKLNPIRMEIPVKVKTRLTREEIEWLIDLIEAEQYIDYEYHNGDLVRAKLQEMLR
jgi:hypothetical protein